MRVLYEKMYPVPWAGKWAVPSVLETRSPIQRPPVAKVFLDARFKGRRDDGPLPEMAAGILDGMRVRLREKHYSYRTEQTYLDWVRRFLIFAGAESEDSLGMDDVKAYLEFLAVDRRVAAATQNQAFNSLLFFFGQVLGRPFEHVDGVTRAEDRRRLPVMLKRDEVKRDEVKRLIGAVAEDYRLMTKLLYGGGLRLMECLRLRVKDVDMERLTITVRGGKGDKDRITTLPVQAVHHSDVSTTMIYTHVLNRPGMTTRSPLDSI